MAPGRTARARHASGENDENAASSILTRAKAAALNVDELAVPAKVLQSKKSSHTTTQPAQRRRDALGDVSNVTKVEALGGKKAAGGKVGYVSKAAQPTGIQKNTARPAASRTVLASKEANRKVEVKRSGAGAIGVQKRKVTASSSSAATVVKNEATIEGEPVRKKLHVSEAPKAKTVKAPAIKEEEYDDEDDADAEEEEPVHKGPIMFRPNPSQEIKDRLPEGVKDLDSEDLEDPLMVAEYSNDIFEYLLDLEPRSQPNPNYMAHQDDLEWKTRGILVDWLIEVHTRFHLVPETLFLAVNIVDRFLSAKVVQLDRLQLVGITAMFIASKYEEVMSPHVSNFRHVTDDGFSDEEILVAERAILTTLNYDLSYPNPMNFLRRISKADYYNGYNYDIHCRTLGKYLMEISLLDHRFMKYRPSHVAAAAMSLSRIILDRGEWDETLAYYAGYTEEEVQPVLLLMIDYLARPVIHEAFFKKYASKKFIKASILTRSWAEENAPHFGVFDTELAVDTLE